MSRQAAVLQKLPTLRPPQPVEAFAPQDRLCFDRFVLTPGERLLTRDGRPVEIGGRSFDLLLALVEQPGRVVSKLDLLRRIWPDVVVEDAALRFHMTRLRKLLGDGENGVRLIATQVGVGYAFVGVLRKAGAIHIAAPVRDSRSVRPPPSRLERLIGRDADLRALAERVEVARLVSIVGAAGVGKTSLAIELVHALATDHSETTFVDLAAVDDPERVVPFVAEALDVTAEGHDPAAAMLDLLARRRRLLVLDTCEHLVQPVACLVERIAAAAPDTRVVVTSRQPLRARNEHVYRLAPLASHSAVALFLHHVRAAGGVVGKDAETLWKVARICARLDGLALPIEVAAARAATHGIDATARLLGDGLSLLWPGRRTAPARQRTLRASLNWSYDLLSDTARRAFEQLSTLDGPFAFDTALDVLVDDAFDATDAAMALDELTENALILPGDGEYRWSETTWIYARERLAEAIEVPATSRAIGEDRRPRLALLHPSPGRDRR